MFVMVKPVSCECNIWCDYCFYRDTAQKRQKESYGHMSESTARILIQQVLEAAHNDEVIFGFQGGEPMLAGLAFYRYWMERVGEFNTQGTKVSYVLQTNGLLIDEEWTDFFQEHAFLVGVSMDGPRNVHDRYRKDYGGEGSFLKTMRGITLLKERKVEFNVLTVLTGDTARRINKVYQFLLKNEIYYQQYIPCMDPLGEEPGRQPYSLTPKVYAEAIKELFDVWHGDYQQGKYVYIRQFENWAGIIKGHLPEACSMAGRCIRQNVVEANGTIYPCDFYVLEQYACGCIENYDWKGQEKTGQAFFLQESMEIREQTNVRCMACQWFFLCRGGCRRDMIKTEDGWQNYYCSAYKNIFDYIYSRLRQM